MLEGESEFTDGVESDGHGIIGAEELYHCGGGHKSEDGRELNCHGDTEDTERAPGPFGAVREEESAGAEWRIGHGGLCARAAVLDSG
jgi:hypothetical protein